MKQEDTAEAAEAVGNGAKERDEEETAAGSSEKQ